MTFLMGKKGLTKRTKRGGVKKGTSDGGKYQPYLSMKGRSEGREIRQQEESQRVLTSDRGRDHRLMENSGN